MAYTVIQTQTLRRLAPSVSRLHPRRRIASSPAAGNTAPTPAQPSSRPLARLSTPAVLRTLLLSRLFSSPALSRFGIAVLEKIANSRQPFLDPDKNLLLNRALRAGIYNHFCAGHESSDIKRTIADIKSVGFKGVILNYAREIIAHDLADADGLADVSAEHIQQWLDGNLKTLSAIGAGDYIGIKYTGAGGSVASALTAGKEPPKQFWDALNQLCRQAKAQGSYLLVDAEQQVYQATIDRWTVDLMREHNRDGDALILNTYQAYLKATRGVIRSHLELAQKEGWILGVKLVRGAYIFQEERDRIHDTKPDTDKSYNGIARDLLQRSFDDITKPNFPGLKLFLAGHNADSIRKASALHRKLSGQGTNPGTLEFGQLYGMADHISGDLLSMIEDHEKDSKEKHEAVQHVFKCVNWGTVRECINFLMRRANENAGAAERLQDGYAQAKRELKARIMGTG
ncbi:proline oxidase Put1 [Karstenula rhodostoma CBS 690.94]|uniref:Proline dehydrogenase n=1 Tax=Karstenula rhodostoma CBS 690.94 TaxID=1392251 RepID=A0A9P4U8F4_9PLEO|nr:proline oxidase Put1 [Karstenula rhodostoma CBS 690.94]